MNRKPIILATLIPALLLGAPNVFVHPTLGVIYLRNGNGSTFEHGLDDGTIMAKRGDAAPNYDDCIGDGGNQATYGNQVSAYCSGVVQGYNAFGR